MKYQNLFLFFLVSIFLIVPSVQAGFFDWLSGNEVNLAGKVVYESDKEDYAEASLKLGGETYKVVSSSDISSDDFSVKVDLDGDGEMGTYSVDITGDESDSVSKKEYFYLKNYGVMRYQGSDKKTSDNPTIKVQDLNNRETIEIAYKVASSEEGIPPEVIEEEPPIEEPTQKRIPCDGCMSDEKCIPYGVRIKGRFCDLDNEIKEQKSKEESCSNNYECVSNVCVNSKCIEASFIQKIINWFKWLFGGG